MFLVVIFVQCMWIPKTNMYAIKNSYKQLEEKHVLLIKKCITGRKSANLEGEKNPPKNEEVVLLIATQQWNGHISWPYLCGHRQKQNPCLAGPPGQGRQERVRAQPGHLHLLTHGRHHHQVPHQSAVFSKKMCCVTSPLLVMIFCQPCSAMSAVSWSVSFVLFCQLFLVMSAQPFI